ncbi:UPF0175 family protein [Candidatus Venteria ishoeyi]|uniref:Uncharacterized protein n=1 Tax=Candidatus Venteria ishoeyi TaxID=1899563 RepID=A0A1H6FAI5_9GAMM|nr:UPF0175 family protein [Candidatus Venteria ishoeyi]SEH06044.1 Uncharacterised protein [Candidatus Venteria ishoeyi]
MQVQLKQDFDEVLEPLGNHAVEFFLAASLYHAHKISFAAAAALAGMGFEEFLMRLREHFDTGFFIADETVEEDLETVEKIVSSAS